METIENAYFSGHIFEFGENRLFESLGHLHDSVVRGVKAVAVGEHRHDVLKISEDPPRFQSFFGME